MAAMGEVVVGRAILRSLQIPQEGMQYVLLGLYEWPPLSPMFVSPQGSSLYSGILLFFFFLFSFAAIDVGFRWSKIELFSVV